MAHGFCGFVFALPFRVDPKDYIGVIEEGSRVVIHQDPEGRVILTRGGISQAIRWPAAA
jgi:hypothetical protein